MSRHHQGGRQWQRARAELKSRGNAYCWRGCGTYLLVDAPRWHPQFMTLGHYLALEDGGSQFDPNNYGPECKACNYGDGARRTNAKLGNPHHPKGETNEPAVDTNWYEAYQVGKPMALENVKPSHACPVCQTPTTRQKYCSNVCCLEAGARQMRDSYRHKVGLPVNETKPTRPRKREISLSPQIVG